MKKKVIKMMKSDVELDGNDWLDLDLDSEHNDNFESDLLSESEDRAGSAEEFQWSPNSSF